MSDARPIAAFDFDGTITQRDTLLGFLTFVAGRRAVTAAMLRHAGGLLRGLRDDVERDASKERVLGAVMGGRSLDDVADAGARYAALLPERFRPEVAARVRWHLDEGHEVVLVSASLEYYLRPVAASLGLTDVIGVTMEADASGRLTGRLARPNVRAEEKAVRLREWWGERPATELWAYGNSSGDEALLALADHPTWIGRRAQSVQPTAS